MKPISVHVSDSAYRRFKALAIKRGRPVAELLREAMERYLNEDRERTTSVLDITAHDSGALLSEWDRESLCDEMRGS